jgi:hypothetical protein
MIGRSTHPVNQDGVALQKWDNAEGGERKPSAKNGEASLPPQAHVTENDESGGGHEAPPTLQLSSTLPPYPAPVVSPTSLASSPSTRRSRSGSFLGALTRQLTAERAEAEAEARRGWDRIREREEQSPPV